MTTHQPIRPGPPGRLWTALRLVEARLRFVAILGVTALVVAKRDAIADRIDRWAHPPQVERLGAAAGAGASANGEAADPSEWYCPMDPGVVRDGSGHCPQCGMRLSRRQRTAASSGPLPAGALSRVALSPARVALAGVATTTIGYATLLREIRAPGTIEVDERRRFDVAARVHGRIEQVRVGVVGEEVQAGDELVRIYSPELVNAQQVFLQLLEAHDARDARDPGSATAVGGELPMAARERPLLLGVAEADLAELEKTRAVKLHLPIRAPAAGTVIAKDVVPGRYVAEGDVLYRLADLSSVWIEARVAADDLAAITIGQEIEIRGRALAAPRAGRVASISPVVDRATRTVAVRADVANEGRVLRPGMFVDAVLRAVVDGVRAPPGTDAPRDAVLAVPESAVIDTGTRRIVYVERSAGVYDAVAVELGPRAQGSYAVRSGLAAGDRVVAQGAFLVDAEARLVPVLAPDAAAGH